MAAADDHRADPRERFPAAGHRPAGRLTGPGGGRADMTTGEFFASPGFGGVCAVLAALLVAWSALVVSRQRRVEADRTAADQEHHTALERWWTQYAWLVSADADRLPFEGRVEILVHLLQAAEALQSAELVAAARAYFGVLRRWIDESAGTTAGQTVGINWSSSVERELAGFGPTRRAAVSARLDA